MACRALCRPTSSSWIDGGGWVVFPSTCSAMESLCLCRVCPVMGRSLTSMLAARLSRQVFVASPSQHRLFVFATHRRLAGLLLFCTALHIHTFATQDSLYRYHQQQHHVHPLVVIEVAPSVVVAPPARPHERAAQSHASHRSAAAQIDMRIGRRSSRDGAAGRGILAVAAATVLVLCCSCISTVSGGC